MDYFGNMAFLAFLALVWGSFVSIFWMITGWRAMRAHEKLADSLEQIARQTYRQEQGISPDNSLKDDQ